MGRQRLDIEVDAELAQLFRRHGFEGLTLSNFEQQTGMARASLYYRFPEGKDGMARAVLAHITHTMQSGVLTKMETAEPAKALKILQRGLLDYYENGRLGCMLGAFSTTATAEKFRPEMQQLAAALLEAVEKLLARLGASCADAKARAEDFLADVQGSLVLTAISGSPRTFSRRLAAAVARLGAEL
jgi:TetR/AcrR family transcriptional regulator, lmrAB and yxaGH operons repressor